MPALQQIVTQFCLTLTIWLGAGLMAEAAGLRQCPAGTRACGSQNCCPYTQTCSRDGYCVQRGRTYCGNGRSCPSGQICTTNGFSCAPAGSSTCGPGVVCGPGTVCVSAGICARPGTGDPLFRPGGALGTPCEDGDSCLRPGWFRCEETGSQCRPNFKCSKIRGCVPLKAVDCGRGQWCRPGEICQPEGGCKPE